MKENCEWVFFSEHSVYTCSIIGQNAVGYNATLTDDRATAELE